MEKLKSALLCLLSILCLSISGLRAQDSSRLNKLVSLPDKVFGALSKKGRDIEEKLDRQTDKYLSKLQRLEYKLKRKLSRKDSLLAEQTFGDINKKYQSLRNISSSISNYSSVYSGHLDSVSTALNFLKTNKLSTLSSNPELEKTLAQYKELQSKLNASDLIKKELAQRQAMLKEQFQKLGMVKGLKQYQKQFYYYQAQVREYKEMLADPSKLETKLLALATEIPQFKEFFANNSALAGLFTLPAYSNGITTSLAGLQTRAMLDQNLIQRFGAGTNATTQLRQNLQAAQGQLSELKNKISQYSNGDFGNSTDVELPGTFKPNMQKTKTFFQRLEYGTNFQTTKARNFYPTTADIGISMGYKLNNNSVAGIGASYKLGLGKGVNNIAISNQGVGLRSFLDVRLRGSLYLSGGLEYNYQQAFEFSSMPGFNTWQSSGLLGLSKTISRNSKVFKKTKLQVLWDFLSYDQIPRTEPIKFRFAYNF